MIGSQNMADILTGGTRVELKAFTRRGGEMVNAADLKSAVAKAAYGFDSLPRH